MLCFAVLIVAMFGVAPIRAYLGERDRLADLRRDEAALIAETEGLRLQADNLRDPQTLERLARECLGFVLPGRVAFVTIPRGEAPTPPDCD